MRLDMILSAICGSVALAYVRSYVWLDAHTRPLVVPDARHSVCVLIRSYRVVSRRIARCYTACCVATSSSA